MTAIQINGLNKAYGSRQAVADLNLTIEQGSFFALLGPNGAGKTTTIRMLCCLTPPTGGDALLMGHSIVSDPFAVKRCLNVSPQETAVAPNLSVRENLELIAGVYGSARAQAREQAAAAMVEFGLEARAKDRAKTLSGGLQRRLSIAMGLISGPQILFLDEPTLGLDVRARRDLWKAIQTLKGKITIVLTTHYLEEAEALADCIGIMHEGRLRALGTAQELTTATGQATFEEAFLMLTDMEDAI